MCQLSFEEDSWKLPQNLVLTYHWPECNHKVTPRSCEHLEMESEYPCVQLFTYQNRFWEQCVLLLHNLNLVLLKEFSKVFPAQ